jgi:hypothetical protein
MMTAQGGVAEEQLLVTYSVDGAAQGMLAFISSELYRDNPPMAGRLANSSLSANRQAVAACSSALELQEHSPEF